MVEYGLGPTCPGCQMLETHPQYIETKLHHLLANWGDEASFVNTTCPLSPRDAAHRSHDMAQRFHHEPYGVILAY
jgi:5,10-methylenetetrahydrofolate reductase